LGRIGDAGEEVGLRVDAIELRGLDERVGGRRSSDSHDFLLRKAAQGV
jgi:hypothetical protein